MGVHDAQVGEHRYLGRMALKDFYGLLIEDCLLVSMTLSGFSLYLIGNIKI